MSDNKEPGQNWRTEVVIDDEHEDGPSIIVKGTGETAFDILTRVLESGAWDAKANPEVGAVLELAAELMEEDSVLDWVDREILVASETDEARAVRQCYLAYQEAILLEDADAIAAVIDTAVVDRYHEYRTLALTGGGTLGNSDTPAVDRVGVGMFRKFFTTEELERMDDTDVIFFAIDQMFAGPDGAERFSIGLIEVDGDEAAAELFVEEMQLPVRMHFRKSGGAWRVDITSFLPILESTYGVLAGDRGLTMDEFITAYIDEMDSEPDE